MVIPGQVFRGVSQLILRRRIGEKYTPSGFKNKHQIIQGDEKTLQALVVFRQRCEGGGAIAPLLVE